MAAAEAGLDKLTAALLHAHRAVIIDPLDRLDTLRRRDGISREELRAALCATLHHLAWIQPLYDHGTVLMIRSELGRDKRWRAGAWPRMRRRSVAFHPISSALDKLMGMDRVEREFRYAVQAEWRAATSNMVRDRVITLNELGGRAHLYASFHARLDDYDVWWDEERIVQAAFSRAVVLRLVAGLRLRHTASAFSSPDERRVRLLLTSPVPDLSVATATDLVSIRESGSFGSWRYGLATYIDAYEAAAARGEHGTAQHIAEELRSDARRLERECERSTALSAIKGGLATLRVSVAGALAAAPVIGSTNLGVELAIVASTSLVDILRRLRMAQHRASGNAYVRARASVARAAAERFNHLP